MKKTTPLYALGIILLVLGLSFNPVVAENMTTDKVTLIFIDEDGSVSAQTLTLSETELQELNQILSTLMEKIQSAPDYATVVSLLEECMKGCCKHSGLQTLFSFLMKTVFRPKELYRFCPFRQNVIVVSSGFTNKLFSLQGTHMNMHRAFTFWFYSTNSNIFINSKTTIVDPYPFNVKTLTGRQIGIMRGFTGLYITQHSTMANKEYTYFMGYARSIIGYDLSV